MSRLIVGGVLLGLLLAHAGPHFSGVLVLGGSVVALWALHGPAMTGRVRSVAGHGHGARRTLLRHEAGHVVAAKALGQFKTAVVRRDDGFVRLREPARLTPAQYIAFMRVGELAAGTGTGCSGDRAAVREEKARMRRQGATAAEVRQAERVADRMAARWAASGDVEKWAQALARKGHL